MENPLLRSEGSKVLDDGLYTSSPESLRTVFVFMVNPVTMLWFAAYGPLVLMGFCLLFCNSL